LKATLSFNGASGGAIFGVFTLGIFIPGANTIVNLVVYYELQT